MSQSTKRQQSVLEKLRRRCGAIGCRGNPVVNIGQGCSLVEDPLVFTNGKRGADRLGPAGMMLAPCCIRFQSLQYRYCYPVHVQVSGLSCVLLICTASSRRLKNAGQKGPGSVEEPQAGQSKRSGEGLGRRGPKGPSSREQAFFSPRYLRGKVTVQTPWSLIDYT